jgi:hypothetical protein
MAGRMQQDMIFRASTPEQRKLASDLGFKVSNDAEGNSFSIALRGATCTGGSASDLVRRLLVAARLHCLSADEAYFLGSTPALEIQEPLGQRNEAAAVSLLLQNLGNALDVNSSAVRSKLLEYCCRTLNATISPQGDRMFPDVWTTGSGDADDSHQSQSKLEAPGQPSHEAFHAWAEAHGIRTLIRLDYFDGLRGCRAERKVEVGEKILSIPRKVLIYSETVCQTDLGRMLSKIPNLSMDNLLIIFTMIDRHDAESEWAPFWASLPGTFMTGFSFPKPLVDMLQGTAAHLEIARGQEHLMTQYKDTRPLLDILLQAYPEHLAAEWFEFEQYRWACELWYSYAFEVEFPSSTSPTLSKTAMVPFACHVNHSPWPHVVRYGRLNSGTDSLDFPAFRPCPAGSQAFISYGPVPNLKLLSYYGFIIPNNPHDTVGLRLEAPEDSSPHLKAAMQLCNIGLDHNLRNGPLSLRLLACVRLVVATDDELKAVCRGSLNPLIDPLPPSGEAQALDTLMRAFESLLDTLMEVQSRFDSPNFSLGGASSPCEVYAVKACKLYVEGQLQIVQRAVAECVGMRDGIGSEKEL